ncbi:MAG: hypothetical protein P8075_14125 [Deltaproteobacteria bacterium]
MKYSETEATLNPPFPLITRPYATKGPVGVLISQQLIAFDLVIGSTLDPGCISNIQGVRRGLITMKNIGARFIIYNMTVDSPQEKLQRHYRDQDELK